MHTRILERESRVSLSLLKINFNYNLLESRNSAFLLKILAKFPDLLHVSYTRRIMQLWNKAWPSRKKREMGDRQDEYEKGVRANRYCAWGECHQASLPDGHLQETDGSIQAVSAYRFFLTRAANPKIPAPRRRREAGSGTEGVSTVKSTLVL